MTTDVEGGDSEESLVDLRGRFRPVGDQGRRGTCVAFAVTAIHEADLGPTNLEDEPDDLSEEVLFWGAKQMDGDTADGSRFTSANAALQQWGQPPESLWPYDERRDHRSATYAPPPGALDPQLCHLASLRSLAADADAVRAELDAGRPIVIGIPVWNGLREARNEPLPPPTPGEIYPTRHAVVAVGYDLDGNALLIRNSWGRRWGNDGYLWVDMGVLTTATGAWVVDTSTTEASFDQEEEEVLT